MKSFSEHSAQYFKDGITCPTCKKDAPWVDNILVYGKRYGKSYMCYYCKDCNTYVGCHNNTKRPLGTMANPYLRKLRRNIHGIIDPWWKSGKMTRNEVYKKLENMMGKTIHVGESDEETCKEILLKLE